VVDGVAGGVKSAWGSGSRKTFYGCGRAGLARVRRPLRVHRRRFLYRSRARQAADRSAGPVSHGRRHIATSFTRRQTTTCPPPPLKTTPTRLQWTENRTSSDTIAAIPTRRHGLRTVFRRDGLRRRRRSTPSEVHRARPPGTNPFIVVSRGVREYRARAVRH